MCCRCCASAAAATTTVTTIITTAVVTCALCAGAEKFGNAAFQDFYASMRGEVTSSWWNKYDVWPLVPATNVPELNLLNNAQQCNGDLGTVVVNADTAPLPNWMRWRIVPGSGECRRMTAPLDQPCAVSGEQTCTLNCNDHEPQSYFDSIKACVGAQEPCLQELQLID